MRWCSGCATHVVSRSFVVSEFTCASARHAVSSEGCDGGSRLSLVFAVTNSGVPFTGAILLHWGRTASALAPRPLTVLISARKCVKETIDRTAKALKNAVG
jgi:hypothetical protein